jgi:hypothetical protein
MTHNQVITSVAVNTLKDILKVAAVLTTKSRDSLSNSAFALPGRRYPIHDESHARAALSMVAKFGNPEEKNAVRAAVAKRYPHIGAK